MSGSKTRVAFVLPDMRGGGAERVGLTLITVFVDRGYEVDLVLAKAEGELLELLPKGVRVFNLQAKRYRNALGPLVRYLRERRPASVQVSMWPLTALAVVARAIAGVPSRLAVSDHAILSLHYVGRVARTFLATTVRLFYPLADARIAVSEASARDLSALSGLGPKAFRVIYNPVAPAPATAAEKAEAEDAWPAEGARMLTVGSLVPVKNHALLISALKTVNAQRPASLVILGEGECREELRDLAEELGVADRVALPGFKINPTAYFESADLFVLSSDHEAFPLVLVEALAAGLPIVSTDCGGQREILGNGRFGRLVPVRDANALATAILEALRDHVEPEVQSARARDLTAEAVAAYAEVLLPGGSGANQVL